MIKQVRLINKLFGCFVTPTIFKDEELEFVFVNRDELTVKFENMERTFNVWQGELFDEENNFMCYIKELEVFEDFKYRNKDNYYEVGF